MRRLACEHLIQHGAQRIDIGALIDIAACKLFRRHVLWRGDYQLRTRECRRLTGVVKRNLANYAKAR